jgi:hypothetical protein
MTARSEKFGRQKWRYCRFHPAISSTRISRESIH